MAEETGIIIALGEKVLHDACKQIHFWNSQHQFTVPLFVSVNVSGKQLVNPGFLDQVRRILKETDLDAGCLKLEITESTMMENTEFTLALLTCLNSMGIQVNLDDFGTGYSSLSCVRRFPIDTLKIDRSFIKNLAVNTENFHIVGTIIALAKNLDMAVVAEGVEEATDMAELKELNCTYAQGYHFSKPVNAEAASELIAMSIQW